MSAEDLSRALGAVFKGLDPEVSSYLANVAVDSGDDILVGDALFEIIGEHLVSHEACKNEKEAKAGCKQVVERRIRETTKAKSAAPEQKAQPNGAAAAAAQKKEPDSLPVALKNALKNADQAALSALEEVLTELMDELDHDLVFESIGDMLVDELKLCKNEKAAREACDSIALALQLKKPAPAAAAAAAKPKQAQEDEGEDGAKGKQAKVWEWTVLDRDTLDEVYVGKEVMALYWEDNAWYKARVDRVTRGDGTLLVTFIDYGNQEQVGLDSVKIKLPVNAKPAAVKILAAPVRIGGAMEEKKEGGPQLSDDGPTKKQQRAAAKEKKLRELEAERKRRRDERAAARKEEAIKLYLANAGSAASRDIDVNHFDLSTPDCTGELIHGAPLKLVPGRRYGLIGRNGIGKTTLMKAVANYEIEGFPQHLRVVHVEQEVMGDETSVIDCVLTADVERTMLLRREKELATILGKLEGKEGEAAAPAEPVAPTPQPSAAASKKKRGRGEAAHESDPGEELAKVYARMKAIDAWEAENRAAKILAGLQFSPERMKMRTKELSGGWRMRLALAQALFVKPDLLLLDEPTNHLDFPAVIWLEEYLQKYESTLILVSHDRAFINNVITDVMHLHNKTIEYYRGDYTTFERVREEQRKQQHSLYEAQMMKRAHIQKFIDKFRYNANRAALVQSRIKALEKMEVIEDVEDDALLTFDFPDSEPLSTAAITCSNVNFSYPGAKSLLLTNVHCGVDMQSRIGVVGANGAGKSTLIKLLLGELNPSAGNISRNGGARVSLFAQHQTESLDVNLSPLDQLMALFPKNHPQTIRRHLGRFGITGDLALQRIDTLSGGQKSRVSFAIVTWPNPHVIIMDEPTNHLDLETIDGLIAAINKWKGGVLLVSHDQHFLSSVGKEFWAVSGGVVKRFGTFADSKNFCYQTGD